MGRKLNRVLGLNWALPRESQACRDIVPMDSETSTAMHQYASASYGSLAFADSNAALAQMGRYTADLKRLLRENEDALRQIEPAHLNSLTLLSRAAEFGDDDTGGHMDRVGALSMLYDFVLPRPSDMQDLGA